MSDPTTRIVNADGTETGDWFMPWTFKAHKGFDLGVGERRIQITSSLVRKKLRIFVDGKEWTP